MILELTCLANKCIRSADASAAAYDGELAADVCGYVLPCIFEYGSYHRCDGSLAVGTADTYRIVEPCRYYPQQLRTLYHRYAAAFCSHHLGIIGEYGRGIDYQIGAFDIAGPLTDGVYLHAHLSYRSKRLGLVVVRSGDVVPLGYQHLCQRIHAAAAYPHHMYMLFAVKYAHLIHSFQVSFWS